MDMLRTLRRTSALAAVAVLAACGDDGVSPPEAPDESNERIAITNDEAALESRLVQPDTDVPIDPGAASSMIAGGASASMVSAAAAALRLRLVGQVDPPIVGGEVVQATSVDIHGNTFVASYNMRGAPRLGAVDQIRVFLIWPYITASATFTDSDISAVSTDGSFVYAAEATDAAGFPFPAVLERLKLEDDKFSLEDNERLPLTSYAATSTLVTDDAVYVTSGNTGGVSAFDPESFELLGEYALDDARWVARDEDGGRIVVAQGTPGRLAVFAEGEFPGGSMSLLDQFPFPGADVPESKTTVEIAGGKAFVAAGPAGVQILCLDDGQVVGSIPRPDPAELGLDPAVVVTNAVSVDEDLLFISNGEAGVYLAQGAQPFDETPCGEPQQIGVLGKLRFDDLQSANHVVYRDRWLMVAAGLGGVKLVRVSSY